MSHRSAVQIDKADVRTVWTQKYAGFLAFKSSCTHDWVASTIHLGSALQMIAGLRLLPFGFTA